MNREKELLLRMTGTIVTIVLCLAAMGFSAFAYFSHSISSGMNVIQSAHFDVVVTLVGVKDATDELVDDAGEPNGTDTGAVGGSTSGTNGTVLEGNRLTPCDAKIYTFKIEASGDAQTGYCKIVIGMPGAGQQVYYTTQLYLQPNESEGQKSALTIEIDMTNGSGYTIEFVPQWGTSSHYVGDQLELLGENDKFTIQFVPAASTDEDLAGSDEGASGDGDGSQTESQPEAEPESGVKEYYTVVKGDTLYGIAARYGLTQNELHEFNKNEIANPNSLVIGQVLKIPLSKGEEEPEETVGTATEAVTEPEAEPAGEVAS